jgi:hypothetical protein
MHETFIEILMDQIMEATMIPKAQVERAVGPILNLFLADVLTATLQNDPDLSGDIAMVCPEFPLKKTNNRQSTNIDWLMLNEARQMLLFVELKTSDTSVNVGQNAIYQERIRQVGEQGGGFLLRDLEELRDASNESGKYQYLLEKRIGPYRKQIAASHMARLVYLVPESAEHKLKGHADRILTFSDLAVIISGPYAREWAVVHNRLVRLDQISQRSRNVQYKQSSANPAGTSAHSRQNYQEKLPLAGILELCKVRGDAIVVGFQGGWHALENSSLDYLQQREYKWDETEGGLGAKIHRNWIPGGTFCRLIDKIFAQQG